MRLTLTSSRIEEVVVLHCRGRIIAGPEAALLHDEVRKLQPEYKRFVLDMEHVEFVDSTGLGLLVRLLCGLRAQRGDLKLCAASSAIVEVLQLTKLTNLLETHASRSGALAAFGARSPMAHANVPANAVLCVEKSSDLLAYMREVLRHAHYEPLTSHNAPDAVVLVKSARPQLLVLGPGTLDAAEPALEKLRHAAAGIPVIELGAEFATHDPSVAGSELVARVEQALRARHPASARAASAHQP